MPTLRQRLIARLLHLYPLASGCATVANHPLLRAVAGTSDELVWARSPGGRIRCSLSDYVGKAAFFVGDLDRKISWIIRRLVRPGHVALDIGANIGIVTLLLARQVGEKGRVYAFEPNPAVAALLEQSIAENGLDNVILQRLALGSRPGRLSLSVPRDNAGAGSFVRIQGQDPIIVQVPVETLANVVRKHQLARLDFVKIDVEGFEAEVVRGGLKVLQQFRPRAIVFERNDPAVHPSDSEVLRMLREAGYGFFAIPKCLFRMELQRFDPLSNPPGTFHDFLAAPCGRPYEELAELLRASGPRPTQKQEGRDTR